MPQVGIITGKTRPSEGTVFFGRTIDLLRHKKSEFAQFGFGRKFQKSTMFKQFKVFENLERALKTSPGGDRAVIGGCGRPCSSNWTPARKTGWLKCW